MAKGGAHNKRQAMRYRVLRTFDHGKTLRAPSWTLGAAMHQLRETLIAVNRTGAHLKAQVLDVEKNEVVYTPQKCVVCDEAWATEPTAAHPDEWRTCRDCEGDNDLDDTDQDILTPDLPYTPPSRGDLRAGDNKLIAQAPSPAYPSALEGAVAAYVRPNPLPDADPSVLLTELDRRNLPRAVWGDGTVVATANGMLWTMQAAPHAVTNRPCGVWSVASPECVRGHFTARNAASFIASRRTP